MKYSFILFLLCFFLNLKAQFNYQPVTNFTSKDYGIQFSNYVNVIEKDSCGNIYAGTAYGILQYNGSKWNFIPIKAGLYITSLAYINHTLFVGCNGDFGYLKATNNGKWEYASLADLLSKDDKTFTTIWKILPYKNAVVFQSEEKLFFYDINNISVIPAATSFHLAFSTNDRLLVRERQRGLMEYANKELSFVSNTQQFADTGIFAILPYKENELLVFTQESGLYLWKNNTFRQLLKKKQIQMFSNAMLIGAKVLNDGNIAVYTLKQGVFILNAGFEIVANYTINQGLKSDEIHDLISDYYGNLWVATPKGISRIQYSLPLSFLGQNCGLEGNVQAIKQFNQQTFIGTSEGLYRFNSVTNRFEEFNDIKSNIWAIETSNSKLWIAGDNGLWQMNIAGNISAVSKEPFSALLFIPEINRVLAAGTSGCLWIDALTGKIILKIPEIKTDAYGIGYKKTNEKTYEFWIGSKTQGVSQLVIENDINKGIDFFQGASDGLPNDWISAYLYRKHVVFGTSRGFMRFISPSEINKLSGNTSSAEIRGYFDILNYPKNVQGKSVTAFLADSSSSYAALDNCVYRIHNDSHADNIGFKMVDVGRINTLQKYSGWLWIGGDEGIAIVHLSDLNQKLNKQPDFNIGKITVTGDSVLWFGQRPFTQKEIVLPYELNSIQIELNSLYIENQSKLLYSWKLEGGNQEKFSTWTNESVISLYGLREGNYMLIIKAKNAEDKVTEKKFFNIRIFAPWYRTGWAYTLYVLIFILLIYLIVWLNAKRLIAKNRKLEEIVNVRTQEVVEQKEEIEHQKTTIEHILKDLNDSISYAQRIQEVLLPSHDMIKNIFPDSFVLYKPRNTVSGDFYWAARVILSYPHGEDLGEKELVIMAVADCTGHGVPGAFMSMLGISFLNDIVKKKEITQPSEILNMLRTYVVEALKQSIDSDSQKDGMDISLVAINTKTLECHWAGANNPLYIVESRKEKVESAEDNSSKFTEIKPDKMPIAIYPVMNLFTNHFIQLKKGDCLYMFSDGYADQFGGPKGKKFMYKSFKELLLQNAHKNMNEQLEILDKTLMGWMINEPQNDDITVLGIKI